VEQAGMPTFRGWASILNGNGLLNRIVLDECHITLLAANYCPTMNNICRLVETKVPLVGLSATVPLPMEEPVRKQLGNPSWQVIRIGTQVSNVHLAIGVYRSCNVAIGATVTHVRHYLAQLKPGEGIMVCCRNYHDVDEVAAALGTKKYMIRMEKGVKDTVADDWLKGKFTTIVGTPAISTGMHHPRCRFVLMFGIPYGTIDYAQICCRTGRGKELGVAVMIAWTPHPPKPSRKSCEPEYSSYDDLLKVVDGGECIRKGISICLDGEEHWSTCSSLGYTPCGPCVLAERRALAQEGDFFAGPDMPGGQVPVMSGNALIPYLPLLRNKHDAMVLNPLNHYQFAQVSVAAHEPGAPAEPISAMPVIVATSAPAPTLTTTLAPAPSISVPVSVLAPSPIRALAPAPRSVLGGALATAQALPPQPVGRLVLADAEAGLLRRMGESGVSLDENRHRPIDFATLLDIRGLKGGTRWCAWCLLGRKAFHGHLFTECSELAQKLDWGSDKGKTWRMEGARDGDVDFIRFKDMQKFPSNSTICWVCHWPMHENHGHRRGSPPKSCDHGDLLHPLTWMVWWQPQLRVKMMSYFSLGDEVTTVEKYAAWTSQRRRNVEWLDVESALYNSQCVFLWAFHVLCSPSTMDLLR
jgi:hypothetical protein